ncbi:MAG: DUF58 domain-containing protein [Lentisphaeria bacterium]|nr:DUF58 domain-containing protein [Lentisphaeria bacterium]
MGLVWPTSRGWVVAFACLIWAGVALVNRTVFPFLLAVGTLALLAVSFLCAWLALRGIRVRRGSAGSACAGQAASMPLWITNHSRRRRQSMIVVERLPFSTQQEHVTMVPPLKPQEERLVNRQVLAMLRGEFALRRITLRGGDPAGLFYRERKFKCPHTQVIYPGMETISNLFLGQHETVQSSTGNPVSAAGTTQDFYGVREYNPSDGLRFIHWKSSARFGKLMVREFERNAVMSIAVILDIPRQSVSGKEHWSNLEYQVRAAASICHHCSDLYCDLSFAAGGAKPILIPPRAAVEVSREAMYHLATLQPGDIPVSDLVLELARQLPRKSVVFCLSLSTPKTLVETVELLCEQGVDVRWYCARREAFAPATRRKHTTDEQVKLPFEVAQLHPDMRLGKALSLQT